MQKLSDSLLFKILCILHYFLKKKGTNEATDME